MKTSAFRDGTLKNQPNKIRMTPQHIYTIPIREGVYIVSMNNVILAKWHIALSVNSFNNHRLFTGGVY